MQDILKKPRPISIKAGGQRLRELYNAESINFDAETELSQFGLCCYLGSLDLIIRMVNTGSAPPLNGTETAWKFSYATLIVAGAQRVEAPPGYLKHAEILRFLIQNGLPLEVEDIVGYTALHHLCSNENEQTELARILLENGANPNYQNVYGEAPIFGTFQLQLAAVLDLLLEFGADLDLADADGTTPREIFMGGGAKISAVVAKWVRKRAGKVAPRDENSKQCAKCGLGDPQNLKLCVKCRITRYCSKECQKADWPTHKKSCQPFTDSSTVTLKPFYMENMNTFSMADMRRSLSGYHVDPAPASRSQTPARHPNLKKGVPKPVIIKVQVPMDLSSNTSPPDSRADIMVYTKKRDLKCLLRWQDNPEGYERLSETVRTKGLNGLKAYFAGEMRSKDELVVKIGEVLAEQPF
ncbi:hypothetical protein C8J56DRAFT_799015 [Mycena floridula]|nr:hypothetical protein C8J56DRAFT_799015 [Mycena floridula]